MRTVSVRKSLRKDKEGQKKNDEEKGKKKPGSEVSRPKKDQPQKPKPPAPPKQPAPKPPSSPRSPRIGGGIWGYAWGKLIEWWEGTVAEYWEKLLNPPRSRHEFEPPPGQWLSPWGSAPWM